MALRKTFIAAICAGALGVGAFTFHVYGQASAPVPAAPPPAGTLVLSPEDTQVVLGALTGYNQALAAAENAKLRFENVQLQMRVKYKAGETDRLEALGEGQDARLGFVPQSAPSEKKD